MEWIESLFVTHSAVQTIIVLSLIVSIGLALGKIHVKGISLGVAFVFFIGIVAGSLHFTADAQMLTFAETLGLSLYLACLGLVAGQDFLATVVRPEGLLWVGVGLALTVVPLLIVGAIALKTKKFDFGTICGLLCGAMANPMALSYANETIKGDRAAVAYTSVYPLGMFIRVIIAQVIIMFMI